MERTLILLKPNTLQRGLVGEVITRFEKKGLCIVGMKMMLLTDEILDEHYAHLKDKPFFPVLKRQMSCSPIIACCLEGIDAVKVVRTLCGVTNSREAAPGTIRGDFGMSMSQNIIHSSDSVETAEVEVRRFFKPEELHSFYLDGIKSIYSESELK